MSDLLLQTERLTRVFGGLTAVASVTMDVKRGTLKAVVGPNGAGKTTLFNLVSGIDRPSAGRVICRGEDITKWPAHRRAEQARMARTFQNVRLFRTMTALENVMLGRHTRSKAGLIQSILKPPPVWGEERRIRERSMEALEFVGLADHADQDAASLPYGDQRRVEIARAIAAEPQILLLDEPAAGLNEAELLDLRSLILSLKKTGLTIVLIEHQMRLVMDVSDEIVVLNFGSVLAEGTPDDIQANEAVQKAYLGGRA